MENNTNYFITIHMNRYAAATAISTAVVICVIVYRITDKNTKPITLKINQLELTAA